MGVNKTALCTRRFATRVDQTREPPITPVHSGMHAEYNRGVTTLGERSKKKQIYRDLLVLEPNNQDE